MSTITIITNHHWRNLVSGYELSERERAEFDYMDPEEIDSAEFVRYRDQVIPLSDFEYRENGIEGWDAIRTDSFFSGVVIRLSHDGNQYQAGLLLA